MEFWTLLGELVNQPVTPRLPSQCVIIASVYEVI